MKLLIICDATYILSFCWLIKVERREAELDKIARAKALHEEQEVY